MAQIVTIQQVVTLLNQQIIRVRGDSAKQITHPAPFEQAGAGALVFVKKTGRALAHIVRTTKAAAVICAEDEALPGTAAPVIISVLNPRLAFMRVVNAFFMPQRTHGVHPTAVIDSSAIIDPSATVGPYAVVDADCRIGAETVIHSHVHLYPKTRIGARVVIHSGTVIGADGFGYERNEDGELEKFPHLGGVVIEDEAEIGSNTSIDRGSLGDTVIRRGAKIDNQVHVAHNVVIGRHAAVIAQSMLGGSAQFGDRAWVAPSACILNQVKVGADATVGLGAVVVKDVPDGVTVMGVPARSAGDFRAQQAALKKIAVNE